jgi:hypothetical protein
VLAHCSMTRANAAVRALLDRLIRMVHLERKGVTLFRRAAAFYLRSVAALHGLIPARSSWWRFAAVAQAVTRPALGRRAVAAALLLGACARGTPDEGELRLSARMQDEDTRDPGMQPRTAGAGNGPAPVALGGTCPGSFQPVVGANAGFISDGEEREFIALLPDTLEGPRPVVVAIGDASSSAQEYVTQNGLAALTQRGVIVLAPEKRCMASDCDREGEDGWLHAAWRSGSNSERWAQDEGADVRFLEAMVRCAAREWPIDQARMFVVGHGHGGGLAHRALTFRSQFFSGGATFDAMWYLPEPLPCGDAARAEQIEQGGCCPRPLPARLQDMLLMTINSDASSCDAGDGEVHLDGELQVASNYYAAQPAVVHLACSIDRSRAPDVPGDGTAPGLVEWIADTLASHPKGTPATRFVAKPTLDYVRCEVGRFTDLFR